MKIWKRTKHCSTKVAVEFFDVDGIAVMRVNGALYAMETGKGLGAPVRHYPNDRKVYFEGDRLTREQFEDWLITDRSQFGS